MSCQICGKKPYKKDWKYCEKHDPNLRFDDVDEKTVIVHSNGMVEKDLRTEWPTVYDDSRVGYDYPERYTMDEKTFIRKSLLALKQAGSDG